MPGESPHRSHECPPHVRQAFRDDWSDSRIRRELTDDNGQSIGLSRIKRWREEEGFPNPNRVPATRLETKRRELEEDDLLSPETLPADFDTFGDTIFDAFINLQEQLHNLRGDIKDEITIRLPDDEPSVVMFLSDLHLGHINCQMAKLKSDLEVIRNTPGLYVVLGGDLIDNVVTGVAGRGMHHEQLTSIEIQKYLAEEMVEYLGPDKILAMLLGNHDEWSMKSDDFDPIRYLAKHIGCPYLGPHGYINADIGSQTYRLLVGHQFRMNSSFNKTHAAKRKMDFHGDADGVMLGHKHDAAVEMARVRGQVRFFAQAGSYLRSSVYSERLGFLPSEPEMPGMLVFPDRHHFCGIHSVIDDIWMLDGAREWFRREHPKTKREKAA